MQTTRLICGFFLLLCVINSINAGAVIGVDMGTLNYKAALIMGKTFDIVLNEASSRKTQTAVALHNEDLHHGEAAFRLISRFPQRVFLHPHEILGKKFNATKSASFNYKTVEDETRHCYGVLHDQFFSPEVERKDKFFKPEEITGLIFKKIKENSDAHSSTFIRDTAITVPFFYTQHQRQSIIDAATLGGLSVLSLIDDGTAVALDYGFNKKYNTIAASSQDKNGNLERKILFFDMGFTYTKVTLVSFVDVKEGKKNNTVPHINIIGTAYAQVGGRDLDEALAQYLAGVANKQRKIKEGSDDDIKKNWKAMTKLRKDAQKVKEVLSANPETFSQVEGLLDDFDFSHKITRVEFEGLISHIWPRVTGPIVDVLKENGVAKDDIHAMEIFGGSTRVPSVQAALIEFLGNASLLHKHINSDESAAFGAAFSAAIQSSSFRVSDFKLKDGLAYPIGVRVELTDDSPQSSLLFKQHSHLGSKRKISLKSKDSFNISLAYKEPNALPEDSFHDLFQFYISGVPTKADYNMTSDPALTVVFRLNNNGMVELESAEADVTVLEEITEKVPKSVNKTNATVGAEKDEEKKDGEKKDEEKKDEEKKDEKEVEKQKEEPAKKEKKKPVVEYEERKKIVSRIHKVRLTVKKEFAGLAPLTAAELSSGKAKYEEIFQKIDKKKKMEEAKNQLEAFVYQLRDQLPESNFVAASTEAERTSLSTLLDANGEWLYGDGAVSTYTEYSSRLSEMKAISDKIFLRISEKTALPSALEKANKSLTTIISLLKNVTNVLNVTQEEADDALADVNKLVESLEAQKKKQDALASNEDPVLTSKKVREEVAELEMSLKWIFRRPLKVVKPPPSANTTNSSNSTESSSSSEKVETEKPAEPQESNEGNERKSDDETEKVLEEEKVVVE